MRYPIAPRSAAVDTLHGVAVSDPFRMLEDGAAPACRDWSAAQDDLCGAVLGGLADRDAWAAAVERLLQVGVITAPVWRGGRAFWMRRGPDQAHAVLMWRDEEALSRPLLDPGREDPSGLTTLDAWEPSPDGRMVAVQLSQGGDEEPLLWVREVGGPAILDGPIPRCRYSPVAWLADSSGFYYVRRLPPHTVPEAEAAFHRRVYFHRLGAPTATDVMVRGEGLDTGVDPSTYFGLSLSPDGRWLVVSAAVGTAPRDDVWLLDRSGPDPVPRPVIRGHDARIRAEVGFDGRLWLLTDDGAPRGRLAVVDPQEAAGPHTWTTVIAEDPDAVLVDAALVRGPDGNPAVVALHQSDGAATLSVVAGSGPRRRIDLPAAGPLAIDRLSAPSTGGPDVWFACSDPTTPARVYRHRLGGHTTRWDSAPGSRPPLPALRTWTEQAVSADGTSVSMTLLGPAEPGPRPAVLYGYGGFGVALTPAYSATALAWAAAGGIWATAQLRGGSERGEDWHRAGMRERKRNVFDDFAACADLLRAGGHATAVGILGGSNGGLLVGAAVTQRPDAYDAVVCAAPLLDMVRYEQFRLGRTWSDEYGSAGDPEQFEWLLGYSPYHRALAAGRRRYPPVLFTVFDADSRVDPLHARKLCAALQEAQTDPEAVIVLRRERDVGHGARSTERTARLAGDQLAFLASAVRLPPPVMAAAAGTSSNPGPAGGAPGAGPGSATLGR